MSEGAGKEVDDARRTALFLMGIGLVLLVLALAPGGFP